MANNNSCTTYQISKVQAIKLWDSLRDHFINTAAVIEQIIENRAWEVLGYASFSEAWNARLGDVTLALEVRPHVVYQMLTDGYDYDAIAEKVRGVGRDRVESLDRQRRNGVPAKDASLSVVRQHLRKSPSVAGYMHLQVGPIALKRYRAVADRLNTTVDAIAIGAIEQRFSELENG